MTRRKKQDMRDELKTTLAKRLSAFMALRGESTRSLAAKSDTSHTTIRNLAAGNSSPRGKHAYQIAKALNIKVSELVGLN